MKNLLKKPLNYKIISFVLVMFSLVLLLLCRNESWDTYIQNIIISFAINLISSVTIILIIDELIKNSNQKEVEKLRRIAFSKLIRPINNFDSFITNTYKEATKDKNIELLPYNPENINNIINKIKLLKSEEYGHKINLSNLEQMWR